MHQGCWKISEAKAHFSHVLTASAKEPQVIYNRNEPVAIIIRYQDFVEPKANSPSAKKMIAEIRDLSQRDPLEFSFPQRTNRNEDIF